MVISLITSVETELPFKEGDFLDPTGTTWRVKRISKGELLTFVYFMLVSHECPGKEFNRVPISIWDLRKVAKWLRKKGLEFDEDTDIQVDDIF